MATSIRDSKVDLLSTKVVDFHGRQIKNAGDAVDDQDYVTYRQLKAASTSSNTSGTTTVVAGGGAANSSVTNVTLTWIFGETPSGTINGTNTTFTLAHTPLFSSLHLYLNGLRLQNSEFSVSGNTITITTVPHTGDNLIADYIYAGGGLNYADSEIPTGFINGTNKVFTLASVPISGSEKLYLNGVRQLRGTDYTISFNTITMTNAPQTGDQIVADYRY